MGNVLLPIPSTCLLPLTPVSTCERCTHGSTWPHQGHVKRIGNRQFWALFATFLVRLAGESATAPENVFRRDANRPGHRPCARGQSGTPCRVRGPCLHLPAWS